MRRRVISQALWESAHTARLTDQELLLWIGVITIADDEGRCRATPGTIRRQVFPHRTYTDQDIEAWLGTLQRETLIYRYAVGGHAYLQILSWFKYQRMWHPQPSVIPPPPAAVVATVRAQRGPVHAVSKSTAFAGQRLTVPTFLDEEITRMAGETFDVFGFYNALDHELTQSGEILPDPIAYVRQRAKQALEARRRQLRLPTRPGHAHPHRGDSGVEDATGRYIPGRKSKRLD